MQFELGEERKRTKAAQAAAAAAEVAAGAAREREAQGGALAALGEQVAAAGSAQQQGMGDLAAAVKGLAALIGDGSGMAGTPRELAEAIAREQGREMVSLGEGVARLRAEVRGSAPLGPHASSP